jgi:murein DD-endopeptidase MepM/ murein hydrolase activator NlpD
LAHIRIVLLIGVGGVLCVFYSMHTFAAPASQVPIVQPGAITTPATIILVATPEANATRGTGYHEESGVQRYVVQPGDTLLDVALETGADLASLPCAIAPDFQPNHPLVIGNELVMLGTDLLCHQVSAGETLHTVAARYQTTAASISAVAWNQLANVVVDGTADIPLPVGRYLQIPWSAAVAQPFADQGGADGSVPFLTWMLQQPVDTSPFLALAVGGPFATQTKLNHAAIGRATVPANRPGAIPENWPYGSGSFAWPLTGWLTQGYRYDHRALDIAAPFGTTVSAADRGVVIRAGWNEQGYGLFVIIDHNIDYITLYGHLSEVLVQEGQVVAQGDSIGKVGSTGNSTGPHLHFEIRDFGRLTNPLELLVH